MGLKGQSIFTDGFLFQQRNDSVLFFDVGATSRKHKATPLLLFSRESKPAQAATTLIPF